MFTISHVNTKIKVKCQGGLNVKLLNTNCVPSVILIQLDTFVMKIPGSAMYIVVTLIRAYISR